MLTRDVPVAAAQVKNEILASGVDSVIVPINTVRRWRYFLSVMFLGLPGPLHVTLTAAAVHPAHSTVLLWCGNCCRDTGACFRQSTCPAVTPRIWR